MKENQTVVSSGWGLPHTIALVAVLAFVGIGMWQGWFKTSPSNAQQVPPVVIATDVPNAVAQPEAAANASSDTATAREDSPSGNLLNAADGDVIADTVIAGDQITNYFEAGAESNGTAVQTTDESVNNTAAATEVPQEPTAVPSFSCQSPGEPVVGEGPVSFVITAWETTALNISKVENADFSKDPMGFMAGNSYPATFGCRLTDTMIDRTFCIGGHEFVHFMPGTLLGDNIYYTGPQADGGIGLGRTGQCSN